MGFIYRTVSCNQQEKVIFREQYIWLQFHMSVVETKPHDVKSGSKLPKV